MKTLPHLFESNRAWVEKMTAEDPDFFRRLAALQLPKYLWIGCSDSRVPANQITGLQPGEVFVHRNVANAVVHTDLNCLSVMQFAVDVLAVDHIIVCGHYGCGGVRAALTGERLGLIDNWLRHVKDVRDRHADLLPAGMDLDERWNRLCELNVIEQVRHVTQTNIVRDAWSRGRALTVHGWIYGLVDGRLRDLRVSVERGEDVKAACAAAVRGLD
ncbi:MAG: carbonate dehydratase [Betaproteobacteria bacterium]|nr:MAG: carbonate dehydratase [Betaproteobacteria bacterium]